MVKRLFKNICFTQWRASKCFPKASLDKISNKITESESLHNGELRVVIQGNLPISDVLNGAGARSCALQRFSDLQIWDTEENTGVLIFLLLADHAVEIVADRGYQQKVDQETWQNICRNMEKQFGLGQFETGICDGIDQINAVIAKHFPFEAGKRNELPDEVVMG